MQNKEELATQAKLVREAYFLEAKLHQARYQNSINTYMDQYKRYPHLDGGVDARGVRHKPIWPRIVKFAGDNGMDPVKLVKAVFNSCEDVQLPSMNRFLSKSALEAYEELNYVHSDDIKYDFRNFQAAVERKYWELEQTISVPADKLWRLVILDPALGYGPLFRFCLAVNLANCLDLAARCRHSAMMEYVNSIEAYDAVIGTLLPADFKQAGRELVEKFRKM